MSKVYEYKSFDDDVVTSSGQNFELPEDYRHIRDKRWERLWSSVILGIFRIVAWAWLRWGLNASFVGRKKFLEVSNDKGFFVYGNHTQEFGDPMIAIALGFRPVRRKVSAVCSPSNLGVPVVGHLLPYLGAIPIASGLNGLRKTEEAIHWCCDRARPVVVFPEAHVWPWYTGIRPYSSVSFHYPVKERLPVFAMTVTYHKRRFGRRPRTIIYIDGPWLPDQTLSERAQKDQLRRIVREAMEKRAAGSDYALVEYRKAE